MNRMMINECSKRRLDETYIVVYPICNEIMLKKAETIEKVNIYTFIGLNTEGYRELLGIYQDKPNNNRYWLDCFETLKSRGIKNILYIAIDNNKNIKRTVKIAFPEVVFIDSLSYIIPKFYKYNIEKDVRRIGYRISRLYTRKTLEEYKAELAVFKEKYNNPIQEKLVQKYLNNIEAAYKYSVNIRKAIFTISANIHYYDCIRKMFSKRNNYIEDLKEIYDNLDKDNYFGFSSFRRIEWTAFISDLMKLYPDIELI